MIYPARCPKNPDDDITTISIARFSVMSLSAKTSGLHPVKICRSPRAQVSYLHQQISKQDATDSESDPNQIVCIKGTHCSQGLEENTLASRNSVKMHNACVNDDRQNQTDRNDDRWGKPGIHVYFLPSYFWVHHAIISPPRLRKALRSDGKLVLSDGAQYASTQERFATSPSVVVRKFMRIAVCLKSIQ